MKTDWNWRKMLMLFSKIISFILNEVTDDNGPKAKLFLNYSTEEKKICVNISGWSLYCYGNLLGFSFFFSSFVNDSKSRFFTRRKPKENLFKNYGEVLALSSLSKRFYIEFINSKKVFSDQKSIWTRTKKIIRWDHRFRVTRKVGRFYAHEIYFGI